MSPSQFHHAKKETTTTTNINGLLPPPLKINKESYFIKKSSSSSSSPSSSSSSSSSSSTSSSLVNNGMRQTMSALSYKPPPQQYRHPVIIYTHSPKVIHTHPKDFMALVQKLTGLSRSEEEDSLNPPLQQPSNNLGVVAAVVRDKESEIKNMVIVRNEDNETSSVITEENNCSSSIGENQVNSCFMAGEPSMLVPPLNPYVTNLPVMVPSSAEFVSSSQQLLNYSDSLFFSHNMRTSIPSSATLEGMKEFSDH